MKKTLAGLALFAAATAADAFTIEEIRIRGLERVAEGTVLNYLPLEPGDQADAAATADAVSALFDTGFFDDVRLLRDGNALIVTVEERPAISQIEFTGNDELDGDRLREGLRDVGLGEGQSFERPLLDRIERELEQQYFALGYYDVSVDSTVSPLPRNRVSIRIDIAEGEPASVQPIRFIGNRRFSDETLRDQFQMGPRPWWAFLSDRDRYSRERLSSDLDSLRAFYRDRGYAAFNIDSTQVTISPDRQRIQITVNVDEGPEYSVGEVSLAGELIFSEAELLELLEVQPGDIYTQRGITRTVSALRDKLGEEGYAFAQINPVPEIREADRAVDLTFFVDPASRVYVRRVRITGNETTRDDVIRTEMRQLEGTWLSTPDLRESERRLGRTGFFGDVRISTPRVPGTDDQVDVEVETTERLSGSLTAGVGFGSDQGVILNLGLQQDNVLGTGDRAEFVANSDDSDTLYRLTYLDRNHTRSGIDRRFSLTYRDRDAGERDLTDYGLQQATLSYGYRIPVTSNDRIGVDLEFDETDIDLPSDATSYLRTEIDREGSRNRAIRTSLFWTRDTRDRAIFATEGGRQRLRFDVTVPDVSDLSYYRASYEQARYVSLSDRLTLVLDGDVSYGSGYGDTEVMPFYENFFAGGIRTVRGYRRNSLGPQDEDNESVGGNFRILGRTEVRFPLTAEEDGGNLRASVFIDGGQVWDLDRSTVDEFDEVSAGDLRFAAGLGLIYYSPVGPLTMSVAEPLNAESGDDTQFFQFTIGAFF